jgi:hypothetical protein
MQLKHEMGIFPEYKDRSLQGLLWELRQVVPANEKVDIAKSINCLTELNGFVYARTQTIRQVQTAQPPAANTLSEELRQNLDKAKTITHLCFSPRWDLLMKVKFSEHE